MLRNNAEFGCLTVQSKLLYNNEKFASWEWLPKLWYLYHSLEVKSDDGLTFVMNKIVSEQISLSTHAVNEKVSFELTFFLVQPHKNCFDHITILIELIE